MVERERTITRVERALTAELGREPSDREIARVAKIPLARVLEVRQAARAVTSLDKPVDDTGDVAFGDLLESADSTPPETVEATLRDQTVRDALDALPGDEREVVRLRYGIDGDHSTIEEVVRRLGIPRDRVRRLEAQGLARLAREPAVAALQDAG
jgi:RNA polymerase primary sigma factor